MSSHLQKIKNLIPYLPAGDIPFANKFLAKRDYESLKELTWSSLQRLERALGREVIPNKYRGIDIDKVRELAVECDEYYYLLYPEDLESDDIGDYEEELEED